MDASSSAAAEPPAKLLLSIVRASVPMILVQMVSQVVLILTVQRLGRESAEWLAGASLGALVYNIFGLMLTMAPIFAMDSVAPQAFGAGRLADVGLAAQRSVATALLFLVPAPALWLYAEPLLLALGQPPSAARLAATFVHCLLPALPISVVYEAARRFLYAQDVPHPPMLAAAAALLLHPLWQELLVGTFGFAGGPLALLVTQTIMCLLLLATCAWRKPHATGTWPGLQPRLLLRERRAAWRFLGLSLAALLGLSEWLFWEFVRRHPPAPACASLLAPSRRRRSAAAQVCFRVGRFGHVPLAVHGVAYSLVPLLFMVPLGLSIALTTGVGQKLGAGAVRECKRLAAMTFALGFAVICALATGVYTGRRLLFDLYTSDDADGARVRAGAEAIWPWMCLDLLFDNTFAMLQGMNRGLGLQRRSAACIFVCLWPAGAPLIAFGAQSVLRVWQTMPIIYATLDVLQVACFACADWTKLAAAAQLEGGLASGVSVSSTSVEHVAQTTELQAARAADGGSCVRGEATELQACPTALGWSTRFVAMVRGLDKN